MAIALENHSLGCVLPVRAHAGAAGNGITGEHAGALKVSVTQAPEKGQANRAFPEIIASELGLKKSQVSLLSGSSSQNQRFLLRDINADQVTLRRARRLRCGSCYIPPPVLNNCSVIVDLSAEKLRSPSPEFCSDASPEFTATHGCVTSDCQLQFCPTIVSRCCIPRGPHSCGQNPRY